MGLKEERLVYFKEWRIFKNTFQWDEWGDSMRDILSTFERKTIHRIYLEKYYNARLVKYNEERAKKVYEMEKGKYLDQERHIPGILDLDRELCSDVYDEFFQYCNKNSLVADN